MTVTIEVQGFYVFVVTRDEDNVHRRPIRPGVYMDGSWVATDLSGESVEVREACAEAFTSELVADYQDAFPWVEPSEPPAVIPHLNNGGLARFSGAAPVTVFEAIHMAGVTRISKGRYRVTHEEAMPSDQYSVGLAVMDALPRTIRYTARTANYVEVRVTDLAGAVQDPAEITVQTQRVVS